MFDWKIIKKILLPNETNLPGVRLSRSEDLPPEGATMGTLYIGMQGTGKTTSLARQLVEQFERLPDRAIFVLDWSGSISDAILSFIIQNPNREDLLKRVVYDEMGNSEWVLTLPEFSPMYGLEPEVQAQRVASNLVKLAPELVKEAPFLAGLSLREIAPQLFRLCTAIENQYGESWQVTEAKRLLKDMQLLTKLSNKYGHRVPEAKWYFDHEWKNIKDSERDLRTYALLSLLGAVESPTARARVGYYRPSWTPREAIQKGLMVIINGANLINQENTQHYLFTQVYSLIMSEINTRIPADPKDKPVAIVLDEVYSLLSVPGMAREIGRLSPQYRSRKVQLYVVLQALSQLSDELREQIWSIGNIVCFAISNFSEAYELAQQLFRYDPSVIKFGARSETGQPIVETDRGQYLKIANDIQNLRNRECILRLYLSEKVRDPKVVWVERTKETPALQVELSALKEMLLKERGIRVRDALEVINRRLQGERKERPAL